MKFQKCHFSFPPPPIFFRIKSWAVENTTFPAKPSNNFLLYPEEKETFQFNKLGNQYMSILLKLFKSQSYVFSVKEEHNSISNQ